MSDRGDPNTWLASNPLSTRFTRPGAIEFDFRGSSASAVVDTLRANGWWGEIVGPHGSGKTTLLLSLLPALETVGRQCTMIALRDGQRSVPREAWPSAIGPQTQIIIDGYEQLSWLSRLRIKRRCRRAGCGLLITSHAPCGLSLLFPTNTDRELAISLAKRLLPAEQSSITPADISAAFDRASGNVREMFFLLYDLHEQRRGCTNRTTVS